MRKLTISFMVVSLLSLLNVGALAYDKNLKEHMTFPDDVMVGNTVVKKGDYLVKYNAQTSEVSFLDLNKNKVIATAMATVKVNDKKAESDALYTLMTPVGEKLTGLRLGGQREELTLIEPAVEIPVVDLEENNELTPLCDWEVIPMSDDREEIVVSDVDGIIPEAQIVDYKLVCRPWQ